MRLDGFDLNLLVALDALIEERNVSRAARRLHLSQPALSSALTRLRAYFDDALLIKSGAQMKLTPLAESLRPRIAAALRQIRHDVLEPPTFVAAQSQREFNLSMADSTAAMLMPTIIEQAATRAPQVRFNVQLHHSRLYEQLQEGQLDLALIAQELVTPDQPSCVLSVTPYACVAWRDARHFGKTLRRSDYLAAGHIIVRFGASDQLLSFEEWITKQWRDQRRVELIVPTFDAALRCVVGTQRLVTVPISLAQHYAEFLPLQIFPPPIPLPPLRMAMQWSSLREQDAGHRWLRQLIADIASATSKVRLPKSRRHTKPGH